MRGSKLISTEAELAAPNPKWTLRVEFSFAWKGYPPSTSPQGFLGCLKVAGMPQILWKWSKLLMIIDICKLDLQLLMSWLKSLVLQQATQKAYPCFPRQIQQQWKINVKEHNPRRYFRRNGEQELVYGVVNGMECVFKSPELAAGIISL